MCFNAINSMRNTRNLLENTMFNLLSFNAINSMRNTRYRSGYCIPTGSVSTLLIACAIRADPTTGVKTPVSFNAINSMRNTRF